ncbi:MAG: hypothetical protein M3010_02810 [Candidatus Dormibacteraeota bacterium]|nr:hypothetical protein [Candidatus Dormibacteraeota bacterium]
MLTVLGLAAVAVNLFPGDSTPTVAAGDLALPIRAAFYYPWYPEHWTMDKTHYRPSAGSYSSSDPALIRSHIDAMRYGRIQAGISSWWGRGSPEDARMPALLQAASGTSFKWAINYELQGYGEPSVSDLTSDLLYLQSHYAQDPNYLTIDGHFVVFVYNRWKEGCDLVDRWQQANTGINAYVVLKIIEHPEGCRQPDAWYDYDPVKAESSTADSFVIAPGFWRGSRKATCEASADGDCLRRSPSRWAKNVQDMASSRKKFQLIISFNEWAEGTGVESAREWASPSGFGVYLDALHDQ